MSLNHQFSLSLSLSLSLSGCESDLPAVEDGLLHEVQEVGAGEGVSPGRNGRGAPTNWLCRPCRQEPLEETEGKMDNLVLEETTLHCVCPPLPQEFGFSRSLFGRFRNRGVPPSPPLQQTAGHKTKKDSKGINIRVHTYIHTPRTLWVIVCGVGYNIYWEERER